LRLLERILNKSIEKEVMRKKVVLVLSGGNAPALAHIGVLTILERFKIPLDAVIGTSMGALVGGIYCSGKLKEFRRELLKRGKRDAYRMLIAKPSKFGIVHHGKVEQFLNQFIGNLKIEKLNKKFACVALDLVSGKKIVIDKGNLIEAILASTSIPGVFVPIMKGKEVLVDAGYFDPLPIDIAKDLYKNYFILAVDTRHKKQELVKPGKIPNIINTFYRLIQISENLWTKNMGVGANVLITPESEIGRFQYHHAEKAIMAGEEASLLAIPEIKRRLGMI
jgi:NTE family protein